MQQELNALSSDLKEVRQRLSNTENMLSQTMVSLQTESNDNARLQEIIHSLKKGQNDMRNQLELLN